MDTGDSSQGTDTSELRINVVRFSCFLNLSEQNPFFAHKCGYRFNGQLENCNCANYNMRPKGKSLTGDGFVRLSENFSLSEKRMFGLQVMGTWPVVAPQLLTPFRKVVLPERTSKLP